MSEYISYPAAHEVPALEGNGRHGRHDALDLTPAQVSTVTGILADPDTEIAVRAAYLFDRKGYFEAEDFTQERKSPHRDHSAEIIVQVTAVLRPHSEPYKALEGVREQVRQVSERAKVAEIEAEVARRRESVAEAEAALAEARQRLDESTDQLIHGLGDR